MYAKPIASIYQSFHVVTDGSKMDPNPNSENLARWNKWLVPLPLKKSSSEYILAQHRTIIVILENGIIAFSKYATGLFPHKRPELQMIFRVSKK